MKSESCCMIASGRWTYLRIYELSMDMYTTLSACDSATFLSSRRIGRYHSSQKGVACRSRQGPSGVQTIRIEPDALHSGTLFFAFFNVDYFVHQRYEYVFLVRCPRWLHITPMLAT